MHITVFGATGQVGRRIVQQGLNRGFLITAFGRNVESLIDQDNRNDHLIARKGYIFDAGDVAAALDHADAVISVLGGAFDGSDKSRSLGMKNIIAQMKKKGVQRIVALGGLGVLNTPDNEYMVNDPDYPEEYKPVGIEHLKAFEQLNASGLNWTFYCPPNIIDADETGLYLTSVTYPAVAGIGAINAGDLAHAILDTVAKNEFIHQRVGISNS